jgi:hypothetical protein
MNQQSNTFLLILHLGLFQSNDLSPFRFLFKGACVHTGDRRSHAGEDQTPLT